MKRPTMLLLSFLVFMAGFAGLCTSSGQATPPPTPTLDTQLVEAQIAEAIATAYASTPAPVAPPATPAPEVLSYGAPAEQEGPHAPNVDGKRVAWEVTCNEAVCGGQVGQYWDPEGTSPWGSAEVHFYLPPGVSLTMFGAGTSFRFDKDWSYGAIQIELQEGAARRNGDTNFAGVVRWEELVEAGVAEVRFDRRSDSSLTPLPASVRERLLETFRNR